MVPDQEVEITLEVERRVDPFGSSSWRVFQVCDPVR